MRGIHRRRAARTGSILAILALLASLATTGLAADAAQDKTATPVDVNRANAEQLTALPGIGPAMAQRIIDFRKEHGPFERVEDLLKVKGIGEKSFQKLRPHVTVSTKK